MATKIRLQRHGRKGYPYYHIVIADSRAPRDGKFTEKIGTYNPNTNPATVELEFDRALYWVQTGAQPTDTARNLLSDKGVYLMKHLLGGVKKGAFSQEEAENRFQAWLKSKETSMSQVKSKESEKAIADKKAALEAEKAVNKAKAEEVAKKKAAEVAEAATQAAESAMAAVEEAAETEVAAEEAAPVVTEEAPVAEAAEEPEVVIEEAPVADEVPVVEEASAVEAAPVAEETSATEEKTEE